MPPRENGNFDSYLAAIKKDGSKALIEKDPAPRPVSKKSGMQLRGGTGYSLPQQDCLYLRV